jgi:hypothetical protein
MDTLWGTLMFWSLVLVILDLYFIFSLSEEAMHEKYSVDYKQDKRLKEFFREWKKRCRLGKKPTRTTSS